MFIRIGLRDDDIVAFKVASACENETNWGPVRYTVDTMVNRLMDAGECTHHLGFLTDSKTNFRLNTATTWIYKGTRVAERPKWLSKIRDYLVSAWGSQIMVGVEADDGLSISMTYFDELGIETVCLTQDKDLYQVPGMHAWLDRPLFTIDYEEGQKNLWKQVIIGDPLTDNIPGLSHAASETATGNHNARVRAMDITKEEKTKLRKYISTSADCQENWGPAGALKFLANYEVDEYPSEVFRLYTELYGDFDGSYDYADLRYYETFELVYMLREKPEDLTIHFDYVEREKAFDASDMFEDF
jgi:hypothetical protein